jgi:hypothetical protein
MVETIARFIAAAWIRSPDDAHDRQVFWLSAHPGFPSPSQMRRIQWPVEEAWPNTAAAPQRILTVFPIVPGNTPRHLSNVSRFSNSRAFDQEPVYG